MLMGIDQAWRCLAALASAEAAPAPASDEDWLRRCLARNAATVYGRAHGFADISSAAEYQKRAPLSSYENLAPFIQRMMGGEGDVLFRGLPLAVESTSGSSGPVKYIPYSAESLADFRACLLPWLGAQVKRHGLSGHLYWSLSPALSRPERTRGGIPLGLDDAGYIGGQAAQAVMSLSCVPPCLGSLEDAEAWRAATLYFLVRAHDLSFISVWSPLFFSSLLEALLARPETVGNLLGHGGTIAGQALEPDIGAAARLGRFIESGGDTRCLWPQLKLVSAWADASAAPYFSRLREWLPQAAFEGKGLMSTEAVITVPDGNGACFPPEGRGFTEFLARNGGCLRAEELRAGEEYRVVLTTSGGLYRYVSDDVVRCEGLAGGRPDLRFLGRHGEGCDLAGEKLAEPFVAQCLKGLEGFRVLVPLPRAKPGYLLLLEKANSLETLRQEVENALCANPHYAYARRMGQLGPLRAALLPDALNRYLAALPSGRPAVAKTPAIAPKALWGGLWLPQNSAAEAKGKT